MPLDYEYGPGTMYDVGKDVLVLKDYRTIKWGGNFTFRIGTFSSFDTIYMKEGKQVVEMSKNYPTIKVGRYKIRGMECDWIPLNECKKALAGKNFTIDDKKRRIIFTKD